MISLYTHTHTQQPSQPFKRTPNNLRDLAYKPSVPQGWNAPPTRLANGKHFERFSNL